MAQMRTTVVVTERKRCLMGQVHNLTRTVRVVATTMGGNRGNAVRDWDGAVLQVRKTE